MKEFTMKAVMLTEGSEDKFPLFRVFFTQNDELSIDEMAVAVGSMITSLQAVVEVFDKQDPSLRLKELVQFVVDNGSGEFVEGTKMICRKGRRP